MITINLLPGAAKRRRRQEFIKLLSIAFSMFGLAVIGFGVVIVLVFSQNKLLEGQIEKVENEIAEQENKIAVYEPVITKSRILKAKLSLINDLLANYNHWATFLSNVANTMPSQGTKYVSLSAADDLTMQLSGISDSPTELAQLLAVLKNAYKAETYQIVSSDSAAKIATRTGVDVEDLYAMNEVTDEASLLAKGTINIPVLLFSNIDVTAVSPVTEEDVDAEVDRNINFSLAITLTESAF